MFRFLTISVVTVAIAFRSLAMFFISLEWKLHQTEITEQFCENKDKPEMHCNGKCHLAKELAAAEQKINQQDTKKDGKDLKEIKLVPLEIYFPISEQIHKQVKSLSEIHQDYFWYQDTYHLALNNQLQHPPEIV